MRGDGRVFKRGESWWIQYQVSKGQKKGHVSKGQKREPARIPDPKTGRLRAARTETEARRALRNRLDEVRSGRYLGREIEKRTVGTLLDAFVAHQESAEIRSIRTLRCHLKPIRSYFGTMYGVDVTTVDIDDYKAERKAAGMAAATIRRELEALRGAYYFAAEQTPPLFPKHLVPTIAMPEVHNTRTGFFKLADLTALLGAMPDPDLRDFIEWGFRTGMRKGEIAKLTWSMVEQDEHAWLLHIPGSITKNGKDRSLGFDGDARRILERRVLARRLDCPLIFHRSGRPIGNFDERWKAALKAANLPEGMLFHDLRRSAVRNLIRAGVDQAVAMKVSGHKTDSMFRRYNIITAEETLAAMQKADAYLQTQPTTRNVLPMAVNAVNKPTTLLPRREKGQFGDKRPLTADGDWCRRWDLNPH